MGKLQVLHERPTFWIIPGIADTRAVRCVLVFVLVLVAISTMAATGKREATRYISPAGRDANPGTEDRPWRTFDFAVPRLNPGDALILEDGIYSDATSGFPNINCSAGAK